MAFYAFNLIAIKWEYEYIYFQKIHSVLLWPSFSSSLSLNKNSWMASAGQSQPLPAIGFSSSDKAFFIVLVLCICHTKFVAFSFIFFFTICIAQSGGLIKSSLRFCYIYWQTLRQWTNYCHENTTLVHLRPAKCSIEHILGFFNKTLLVPTSLKTLTK